MILHVTSVECLEPYRLRAAFDDESVKMVDLSTPLTFWRFARSGPT